ncbi:hypothetical protein BAE44_0015991 [Dichanthelium oligosanthes]|uniref:Neprosin activation peptide domain-containing protein n=1 Tax=Dichanthelium oligosanthes TaxID=888268 RepID=A0A1E5VCX3_9POAL|nr:hypothetical protein BAE44_0015991 [Dichanthelium oligosanthes]
MKVGVFIVAVLIFINLCTCMPRDMAEDASYGTAVPQREIRKLVAATDGRNGPPSNDHQCPLGTYPNCQGMSQNTEEIAQDVRGN